MADTSPQADASPTATTAEPGSPSKKGLFGWTRKGTGTTESESPQNGEKKSKSKDKQAGPSTWTKAMNMIGLGPKGDEASKPKKPKTDGMTKPKQETNPARGPPNWELVRNRDWLIENFVDEKEIKVLDDTTLAQGVQVLNCKDFRLDIKKKINSLTIDNCIGTNVQFVDLVGSLSIINCQKCNIQATGTLPAVSVDNSGDIQIYVTNKSRGMSITTSMTGTVNVLIPPENGTEEDDLVEMNIPAQFVHELKGDKVVSRVSDLYR